MGAGLATEMGFPGWTAFLKKLAAECGKADEVAALLADSQYEEAAESIETGLSPAIFNRRVANVFGTRPSNACTLAGAALLLPAIAKGAVVTTNFDRVLERIFREAGSPFEHVAWGRRLTPCVAGSRTISRFS